MGAANVHVIATQHLDVAWLWTRGPYGEELMRQCFEKAVEMIRKDPDGTFVFSRSTAWSFWIIRQRYPELFTSIKKYVGEGRIELCGGEWVEPDHLLPDGESLVRQCALGQWYFLKEFGKCASVCWDPDIFGHPHTFPQILKKCGMDGFYSHRCRPKDMDGKSLHQFIWEGPDGSRIFYLAGAWTGAPNTSAAASALQDQENQALPVIHIVTGANSDRRITMKEEWLSLPGRVKEELNLSECKWSTAEEVLEEMRSYGKNLPIVRGELGFQFCGTYTSNHTNKLLNRQTETLLLNAEKAGVWASEWGFRYPREQLMTAWREHCVNQFHDIICGCSTPDVHVEDRELWADALRRGKYVLAEALAFLCDRLYERVTEGEDVYSVFNLLSWNRSSVVEIPINGGEGAEVSTLDGTSLPVQITDADGTRKALVSVSDVPEMGYRLLRLRRHDSAEQAGPAAGKALILENRMVRIKIDGTSGEITSLYDKAAEFECIRSGGSGNRFEFLEDDHEKMPAWSIKYTGKKQDPGKLVSAEIIEDGPVRQMIRLVRTVHLDPSLPVTGIVQDITLYADSPVIHFCTRGEWYASKVMLKTVFDLAFSCDSSAADAPYGVTERTHKNQYKSYRPDSDTLREDAGFKPDNTFEDPDYYMQKWVDISDGKRGVLFLNDSLYGYDVEGASLRLSLLRAPFHPRAKFVEAEGSETGEKITGLGPFSFTYGILPHIKDWRETGAPYRGHEFNNPLIAGPLQPGYKPGGVDRDWWHFSKAGLENIPLPLFSSVKSGTSMITAVKAAEDKDGIILRIAETAGTADEVLILFHSSIRTAAETDMLERPLKASSGSVLAKGKKIRIPMNPWEIKTVKIVTEKPESGSRVSEQ